MKRLFIMATILGLGMLSACANDPGPTTFAQTSNGEVLRSIDNRTLYTYDLDDEESTFSMCTGRCLARFRPYLVTPDTVRMAREGGAVFSQIDRARDDPNRPEARSAVWASITRPDGRRQWTYFGHPLYLYTGDLMVDDRNGDNLYNVWHVARPQ